MAEEVLDNRRIDQLPPSAGATPGSKLAMWNAALSKTESIDVDQFINPTNTQDFEWVNDEDYLEDEVVTWGGFWYQALQDNTGVTPGTDNAVWFLISKSPSGFVFWQAGAFVEDECFVLHQLDQFIQIFRLANATRPFNSSDFNVEYAQGDWELMSERGYVGIQKTTHGFAVEDVLTFKTGAWNKFTTGDTPLAIVRTVVSANLVIVVLLGNRLKGLTGKTPGSTYYAQSNATISTVVSDNPVYLAVSATEAIVLAAGGGGSGSQDLADVLTNGNDAGGLQIKNVADGTVAQDVVTLSQMTAAIVAAVTGLLDYRGGFSAAGGAYPSSGGSGSAGAILKADVYVITTAGTLPTGQDVEVGDWVVAKIDSPGNTQANWDIIQRNVVLATSSVAGIMKLYSTLGGNTDGTINQQALTAFIKSKSDTTFTITTKAGSYTMAAAENTIIDDGGSLIMDSSSGDLTLPNALIGTGKSFAVRGFANMVNGGTMVITGTNGTLAIPTNRTCIVEILSATTAKLHNGTPQASAWSTTVAGSVEQSTQAEAEAVATAAQAVSTTGLSNDRGLSELGLYYMIRQILSLAWTWAIGPSIADATANTQAIFNGSKKLISNTVAAIADWITGTDNLKAVTVASFLTFRRIRQTSLSVVAGTPNLLTINNALAVEDAGQVATAQTANFTVNWSNHDNLQYYELWVQINGTVVITMTNGTSGQPNIVTEDADYRYNNSTKALTIITTAAKWVRLAFTRQTSGTTGVFSMEVSTPVSIA